jgi:DNA-binding beta-propeller fold protein YncE
MHKRVHRIDTKTDTIVQSYTVPDRVAVAVPSHDGKQLWIGTIFGTIHTIDVGTGLPVGVPIKAPWSSGWLSFTPDGTKVVSVHAGPGRVAIIDVEKRMITSLLAMGRGSFPEYGAITPDGRHYWVALGNGSVKVMDLHSSREVVTLGAGMFSFGVRMSPDGARAFVTTVPAGSRRWFKSGAMCTALLLGGYWNPRGDIVIYDTATFAELGRMPTGGAPTIMSFAGAEG